MLGHDFHLRHATPPAARRAALICSDFIFLVPLRVFLNAIGAIDNADQAEGRRLSWLSLFDVADRTPRRFDDGRSRCRRDSRQRL